MLSIVVWNLFKSPSSSWRRDFLRKYSSIRVYSVHIVDFYYFVLIDPSIWMIRLPWRQVWSVNFSKYCYPSIFGLVILFVVLGDLSTFWTVFISLMIRPFWGQIFIILVNYPFCGLVIMFTSLVIRPLCGECKLYHRLGDLSTLWIVLSCCWWSVHSVDLFWIRPFWTSNRHPRGMVRPFYGHVLYPSILDYIRHPCRAIRPLCGLAFVFVLLGLYSSPSWDDLSISQTYFVSVPFGLQVVTLVGWSVHLVDYNNNKSM